jgi:hypothetical protein
LEHSKQPFTFGIRDPPIGTKPPSLASLENKLLSNILVFWFGEETPIAARKFKGDFSLEVSPGAITIDKSTLYGNQRRRKPTKEKLKLQTL